jgi:hypothetical protein
MKSLTRDDLLELYGDLYGRLGLAIAFTRSTEGDDAKKCGNGWHETKPLPDGNFGSALLKGRGAAHNPAVVLANSGLIGVECDGSGEVQRFQSLNLPQTVTVQSSTPDRLHFWFRPPDGTADYAAFRFEGGKVTADRGRYLLAPPAIHPSGTEYAFLLSPEETPIATLTGAQYRQLVNLTGRNGNGNGNATPVEDVIPEGNRRSELLSLAGSMRRRGMNGDEIFAALRVTNNLRCKPPLHEGEVSAIAHDVAGRYRPEANGDRAQGSASTPFTLQVMTARDLCALPDPPTTDELLGPLVIRGQRLVLGGHTGEGKTSLVFQIVRAIVLGEQLFEWQGIGNVRALVIDAEQGLKTVKRRLREAGLDDNSQVDYARVPDGLELDRDAQHIAAVEQQLAEGGYALVAADPLYKLHTGDSNAEREAVDLMRLFDRWREQYQFALALPVHCRKPIPGTKFTIHDLFGSSAYTRGAEVVLGLQRLRDGYSRLHFLKDRDGDLPIGAHWGLLFDRENGFQRDPEDGNKEPTTVDQVRELLETEPGMTKARLETATGKSERTIQKALKTLHAVKDGGGRYGDATYTLPDEAGNGPDPDEPLF